VAYQVAPCASDGGTELTSSPKSTVAGPTELISLSSGFARKGHLNFSKRPGSGKNSTRVTYPSSIIAFHEIIPVKFWAATKSACQEHVMLLGHAFVIFTRGSKVPRIPMITSSSAHMSSSATLSSRPRISTTKLRSDDPEIGKFAPVSERCRSALQVFASAVGIAHEIGRVHSASPLTHAEKHSTDRHLPSTPLCRLSLALCSYR